MSQSGMLELAHKKLYWPKPDQIWEPSGSGPKVYAQLAKEKIGEKIKREFPKDAKGVKVSVLAANPDGDETEAPIAIVCQFNRPISSAVIKEVHRLAWSFSRARSLITIEPSLIRVWSCCEPPTEKGELKAVATVTKAHLSEQANPSDQAANALQWVELVSGNFFQNHENRFKRSGAADQMLLDNLKQVRQQLETDGLDVETIHDLLARIIFIQFLFQKQDSKGEPVLNERILQDLHSQGVLSKSYRELSEILDNFDDTYHLFRWLNDKFNGDLFPGKGETEEEREAEWQEEIQKIRVEENRYLKKLADFVRGDLKMQDGQLCLWKFYSFDVIPLDFISSIYEEFVNKKAGEGVHYTPEYIVDFILDGALPWDETEWDLKILDPACGSGIFLVKAFQRLIYRWELAHDNEGIPANVLRNLLVNNIFGVDIDKEAVRVASFSLYMTMIDSIDPLKYWENQVRFPRLRNQRLIHSDFFAEDIEGFRTDQDAETYDLVLGNAPWGNGTLTPLASEWQKRDKGRWFVPDKNIGPLFLPKAAVLTKLGGQISMMQPVFILILSQLGTAKEFRNNLFSEFCVEEIINLAILRFEIFKNAISPACIITLSVQKPDIEHSTVYICPKPNCSNEDNYYIKIEPQDINTIYLQEAIWQPLVWTVLMWGGRRDLNLIQHLARHESLSKYEKKGLVKTRQGVIPGDRKKYQEELLGRRRIWKAKFPQNTFLKLNAEDIPINNDPMTHSRDSTDFSAFEIPQLILKQSWQASSKRFQAAIIEPDEHSHRGVICSETCVSVHIPNDHADLLKTACLIYNSRIAVYYLFLLNASFASERPKVTVGNLLSVPIVQREGLDLDIVKTYNDIDRIAGELFALKDSEYVLINDLINYTLADFKGDKFSPGRLKTQRFGQALLDNNEEPELKEYCEYFFRVIKGGFGQDKKVCATIFQEATNYHLPVRLVAIYLNKSIHDGIKIETINSQHLLSRLEQLNKLFMEQPNSDNGGIFYQRVARIYTSTTWNGEQVPTIYLVKPDKIRYWTRSMALRDADEVAADIMLGRKELIREIEVVAL
ncbi:HsdM family class I SAM-dependent methyltransferase [Phormidium tenue]|jgi:type I restriction-modification system DNA methylase subunit|uniref:site-specific DNA-methyltransferase (adenine-specific) n=1 Tax=Phormidium tenue FACHB-1050 TaxID=2692857 RepID=A0ABR8CDF6_9CYAN|nr:N-6 DNA methylase [Phormidium tenue]MBD2318366.1 N-6 DNA methylase [Phormidium tenue FACHB-1050]